MKKILLDTTAYSYLRNGNSDVLDAIAQAEQVYISIVTLGELYVGFRGGKKQKKNLRILNNFINSQSVNVLNTSNETAEFYAEIKINLKKAGTPLPTNDIWIAAHVFETGSTLITYDKHFQKIPGLMIW
jgi:tRNA(fMet)-specific endonuclease VapC